ncbi:hypothetical protein SSX86_032793 [Deinandra increscens subsp. villosa]|uniref:PORR domain-containing protein n=1 Tax=Deinandra increscens subsp. villosa TaxID=3103831 RepID=A0AAP0C2H5_9ASTR
MITATSVITTLVSMTPAASSASASASSVVSSINWVRDRALDHAVEKERDLKPMINVKNLINSEPSKSLPLSIISNQRSSLGIPTRPIDFIRKYPSVFQEFLPGGIGIDPHIKLTPETLTLDAEEKLLFQSEIHKEDVANRLLKLLMISRINKIPLSVIDRLKWDLGLPNDYTQTLVPQFPDYFQVTSNGNELELVCWSDELAVSVMQTNSMSSFPLQYSRGFEVDNKFKKWVDDWQKLPYISPYETAPAAKSEESDKWIVGLLHEVLHLLVPKKTEKDNLLFLGEYLGVRSRFKRALLQHPGIFYVSSKLHTHTVVLREAYKRDLLVSKPRHALMSLRSNYIHLMNMVMEKSKSKKGDVDGAKKQKTSHDPDGESSDENEEDGSEFEGVTDSDSNADDDDIERDNLAVNARTPTKQKVSEPVPGGRRHRSDDNGESEDLEDGNAKIRGRTSRTMKFNDSPRRNTPNSRVSDGDRRRGRGNNREYASDEKSDSRTNRMSDRRYASDSRTNRMSDRRHGSDSRTNRMSDGRYASGEKPDSRTNRMPDRRYVSKEKSDSRTNGMSDRRVTTEIPGARGPRVRSSERSSGVSRTREGRF